LGNFDVDLFNNVENEESEQGETEEEEEEQKNENEEQDDILIKAAMTSTQRKKVLDFIAKLTAGKTNAQQNDGAKKLQKTAWVEVENNPATPETIPVDDIEAEDEEPEINGSSPLRRNIASDVEENNDEEKDEEDLEESFHKVNLNAVPQEEAEEKSQPNDKLNEKALPPNSEMSISDGAVSEKDVSEDDGNSDDEECSQTSNGRNVSSLKMLTCKF